MATKGATRPANSTIGSANVAHKSADTLQGWHERLGHLHKQAIVSMANQRAPSEMTITRIANDLKVPCLGCALGKHTRSEQSKEDTSQSAPSEEIGSVVCMDLKGKIKPRDRLGNQYLAVFVDHASGFTAAVPIKKKSEAERECKTFINALERAHNVVIKVLRSDRGGEFLSAKLKSYLEDKGITHQTTQGSTSASNGKAERMIRTLMDATRTMIFDCDLPPTFWSDAAKHAAYLRNRVPTRTQGQSPPTFWE
ncbi:hypothetical protein AeRB84_015218 [Aphanomyces euteiches]|nr:hypothetical protein AeRB84_015218 [Aphanomyces euteiches]